MGMPEMADKAKTNGEFRNGLLSSASNRREVV